MAARSGRCGGVGLMGEGTWGEGWTRGRRPPWRAGGTAGCAGEQPSPSDTRASPGDCGGGGGDLVQDGGGGGLLVQGGGGRQAGNCNVGSGASCSQLITSRFCLK